MARSEDTLWCDGCGTEIRWVPFVFEHHEYCCQECAAGISCDCGALEWEDEYRDEAAPLGSPYSG
jgi:hypothetical protein